MVSLKKISKQELKPLVRLSYENDEELFNKFHVGRFNLQQCVEKTIEMIEEAELSKPINYYKVEYDGKEIGYVVTFDNTLYSFSISMQYRKKDILIEWWDRITELLGSEFLAILYRNNTRASDFLKRQNMKVIIESVDDNYLVFCNN